VKIKLKGEIKMKKVFDINKMKKVSKGARKKSIEIRIFLDNESIFLGGDRMDEQSELAIKRVLKTQLFREKLENGYIEDNQKNRDYLKFLQVNEGYLWE
jgi:hypothetical protein